MIELVASRLRMAGEMLMPSSDPALDDDNNEMVS